MRILLTLLLFAVVAQAQSPTVAITMDDLPAHGPLPPGVSRLDLTRAILADFKAGGVPEVYGFVNAGRVPRDAAHTDVLQLWTAAGYPLGNHSFLHKDLADLTPEAFEEQITANEPALRQFSAPSADWHWFRYPFLSEGETAAKQQAVKQWLAVNGYRVAQVTMDFEDYAWNDPYVRCLTKQDQAGVQTLRDAYLQTASTYIDLARFQAHTIYGRDISYVLLSHVGAFEAVMLPSLLQMFRAKGFTFTTLAEAERDPAYNDDPVMGSRNGGTMLEQMYLARHLRLPPHQRKPFALLE